MIYDSANYVKKDLAYQRKLLSIYEKEIKKLPKGGLSTQTVKGRIYYTHTLHGEKKYLGRKNMNTVHALQKRHFLATSLNIINSNIWAMERLLNVYKAVDPNTISHAFTKAYKPLPPSCFNMSGSINLTSWEAAPYKKCMKYPEELKHKTMKGDLVRSKSEVIIANALTVKNIPYHYEEELKLSDITLYPDFKIAVGSENRYRFLEHCGMISDPEYRDKFLKKMNTYILNGYVPFIDVIFTFDDLNNDIDTQLINKVIDAYLL